MAGNALLPPREKKGRIAPPYWITDGWFTLPPFWASDAYRLRLWELKLSLVVVFLSKTRHRCRRYHLILA